MMMMIRMVMTIVDDGYALPMFYILFAKSCCSKHKAQNNASAHTAHYCMTSKLQVV